MKKAYKFPSKVNILGKTYPITYVDNLSDADHAKIESVYGSIDLMNRTIRVYRAKRQPEDIFDTVIHEILHGVCTDLSIKMKHDDLNTLATALADTFIRNRWIKLDEWARSI